MPFEQTVSRGGDYNRLADPAWTDPLDISYSRARGGRWNPPGAFGALYLNRTLALAQAQARHKLRGQPYDVEDLDPSEQHDLIEVVVPTERFLDCVRDNGLEDVGLPTDYPERMQDIGAWPTCQAIGNSAYEHGRPGVACRSAARAAPSGDEELAVFEGPAAGVLMTGRRVFADWYF